MSISKPPVDGASGGPSTKDSTASGQPGGRTGRSSGDVIARTALRRPSNPSLSTYSSAPPPFARVDPEPPDDVLPPRISAPPAEPISPVGSARARGQEPHWDDATTHLLGGRARIRLAVRASLDGHVLDLAGRGDRRALAAAAATCQAAVTDGGLMLGLGEVEGWVALTDDFAVYCYRHGDGLVACHGSPQKTAIRHLASMLDQAQAAAT